MGYLTGQVELGRLAVIQEFRSAPVVPLKFFFDNVLPPLPPTLDFEKLQLYWRSERAVGKHGWPGFTTLSKGSKGHHAQRREKCGFRSLMGLFNHIVNSVSQGNGLLPRLRIQHTRNPTPLSMRTNNSSPDGFLELLEPKSVDTDVGKTHWEDIPVSIEFTKSNSQGDRLDNRAKVVWSLHQMMRNDPSRRFAFGITIENTEMRVWFCCRSALLVSEGFEIWKDQDTVIRLFVSLAFGTTSQLGYDPTVKRVEEDGKIQYDFVVGDTTYRTSSVLSDFGAEPLLGRGTRVFQVYDTADPTRTPRTLKDVWVETDRKREGAILADVLEKIGSASQGQDLETARRHFLTVERHEDVVIDGRTDHTNHFWGGEDFPAEYDEIQLLATLFRQVCIPEISDIPSTGVWVRSLTPMPTRSKLGVSNRAHYRIVLKEVGVAMPYLSSLRDVCQALSDAVEGLRIIHAHGYVHRDVSPGNIIFHDGHGKIADFEYAKEVGTGAGDDDRAGTLPFIALEVASRAYLFMTDSTTLEDIKNMIRGKAIPSESNDVDVPFTFNPLHDLESIWWIATFFIFHCFTVRGHDRRPLNIDADDLFRMSRHGAFISQTRYQQMIGHLPTELHMHGHKLNIFRQMLHHSYWSAESNPHTINKTAFNPLLYEALSTAFGLLRDDRGSLAACVNEPEPKKQSLVDNNEEVDKSFGESSLSPGKRKTATKRTSMGDAVPRRSTRLRKVEYEQQTQSDDYEDFKHSESRPAIKRRKKVNDRQSNRSAESTRK